MIVTTFCGKSIKIVEVTTRYCCISSHVSIQHSLGKQQTNVRNLFKVNNRPRSGLFIANFEQISRITLVFPPLTLNNCWLSRNWTTLNHHSSFILFLETLLPKIFKVSMFFMHQLGYIDKKIQNFLTAFGR